MTGPRVMPRTRVPEPTERQWDAQLVDFATTIGYQSYHTHDSRRSDPGFPDRVFIRPPRLIVVELKVGRNKATPDQLHWLDLFRQCGIEAYLWYPRDWEEATTILQLPRRPLPTPGLKP